jgi:DNA-binding NtrC family response regulator
MGIPAKRFSPEALEALQQYSFPGNIRELENMVERACILAEGEVILPRDLGISPKTSFPITTGHQNTPPQFQDSRGPEAATDSREKTLNIKELEREAILEALRRNKGNRTRAAKELASRAGHY